MADWNTAAGRYATSARRHSNSGHDYSSGDGSGGELADPSLAAPQRLRETALPPTYPAVPSAFQDSASPIVVHSLRIGIGNGAVRAPLSDEGETSSNSMRASSMREAGDSGLMGARKQRRINKQTSIVGVPAPSSPQSNVGTSAASPGRGSIVASSGSRIRHSQVALPMFDGNTQGGLEGSQKPLRRSMHNPLQLRQMRKLMEERKQAFTNRYYGESMDALRSGNSKVYFGGKIVFGPDTRQLAMSLFATVLSPSLVTGFLHEDSPIALLILLWVSWALTVVFLVITGATNPGIVQRRSVDIAVPDAVGATVEIPDVKGSYKVDSSHGGGWGMRHRNSTFPSVVSNSSHLGPSGTPTRAHPAHAQLSFSSPAAIHKEESGQVNPLLILWPFSRLLPRSTAAGTAGSSGAQSMSSSGPGGNRTRGAVSPHGMTSAAKYDIASHESHASSPHLNTTANGLRQFEDDAIDVQQGCGDSLTCTSNQGAAANTAADSFMSGEASLRDVPVVEREVRLRYCFICFVYRGPRTHHCRRCDNCVDIFDHHCPWTGTCIGANNYHYFLPFLFFLNVMLLLMLIATVIAPINRSTDKDISLGDAMLELWYIPVVIYAIGCMAGYTILSLFCYHLYIVSIGVTTLEHIRQTWLVPQKGDVDIEMHETGDENAKRKLKKKNIWSRHSLAANCWSRWTGQVEPSTFTSNFKSALAEEIFKIQHPTMAHVPHPWTRVGALNLDAAAAMEELSEYASRADDAEDEGSLRASSWCQSEEQRPHSAFHNLSHNNSLRIVNNTMIMRPRRSLVASNVVGDEYFEGGGAVSEVVGVRRESPEPQQHPEDPVDFSPREARQSSYSPTIPGPPIPTHGTTAIHMASISDRPKDSRSSIVLAPNAIPSSSMSSMYKSRKGSHREQSSSNNNVPHPARTSLVAMALPTMRNFMQGDQDVVTDNDNDQADADDAEQEELHGRMQFVEDESMEATDDNLAINSVQTPTTGAHGMPSPQGNSPVMGGFISKPRLKALSHTDQQVPEDPTEQAADSSDQAYINDLLSIHNDSSSSAQSTGIIRHKPKGFPRPSLQTINMPAEDITDSFGSAPLNDAAGAVVRIYSNGKTGAGGGRVRSAEDTMPPPEDELMYARSAQSASSTKYLSDTQLHELAKSHNAIQSSSRVEALSSPRKRAKGVKNEAQYKVAVGSEKARANSAPKAGTNPISMSPGGGGGQSIGVLSDDIPNTSRVSLAGIGLSPRVASGGVFSESTSSSSGRL